MIMSFSFDFSAQSLDRKDNVQGSHNKYNNSLCMCTVFVLYYLQSTLNIVKIYFLRGKTKRFISFCIYTHTNIKKGEYIIRLNQFSW